MKQYLDLLQYVIDNGVDKSDRTGTGTKSIFSYEMRFDLSKGFPLLTTKKLHLKSIVHELLWFLSGSTNVHYLKENGVSIWNEWADENGQLGPVYGHQWRYWENSRKSIYIPAMNQVLHSPIDQIAILVDGLKNNPDSRRHIVSAWNPSDIEYMALPPCHCFFQCYVVNDKLSLKLTQRSADIFLGVPFNVASYSLLVHMLAHQCGLEVGEFIWSGGDCHLYVNHLDQAKEQLSRTPTDLPTLRILRKPKDIFSYTYEDFRFENYEALPNIKAPVAI